tara:strand:+ start:3257 stop:6208 length:2952 start_codon:yes stop_codon:yes gene_type:complete
MFQTLVEDPLIFLHAEPKRSRGGDGGQKNKKKNKRSPAKKHLGKIRTELNNVTAFLSKRPNPQIGAFLQRIQSLFAVMCTTETFGSRYETETFGSRYETMKNLVQQLHGLLEPGDHSLSKLLKILSKGRPEDRGQVVVPDSSDEDMLAPSPMPKLPMYVESKDHGHNCKCADCPKSGGRSRKKPMLKEGTTVLVTLKPSFKKYKSNKLTRLLAKGPQELELRQIGASTLTFVVSNKGIKSSTVTIERERVGISEVTSVNKPEHLQPQILIEMRWKGDPKYELVRYAPSMDGVKSVIYLSTGDIYQFNEEDDDWRYPEYPQFDLEDHVILNGREAVVMDKGDSDHTYICEWTKRNKDEPKNFLVDVWFTVITPNLEQDDDESDASVSSESSDDEIETEFELKENVDWRGVEYKISKIDITEDGIHYTLKARDGNIIGPIRQEDLINHWDPEYYQDDDVVFQGKPGRIEEINHDSRNYRVECDDNAGVYVTAEPEQLTLLEPLSLEQGHVVFYDYGYFTVEKNRFRYTLKSEDGKLIVNGVSESDLDGWILVKDVKKKTNEIYHITRRKEKKVKGSMKLFYEAVNKEGKKKDIMASSPNVKEQADAHSFFEDISREDDKDLDNRIVFRPGEKVIVIGSGSSSSVGTIVKHNITENVSDETYDVSLDGVPAKTITVPAGQLDKVVSSSESDIQEIGDTVTDKDDNIWKLVRFEGPSAIWEVLEAEDDDEDDDDEDEDDEDDSHFKTGSYVTLGSDPSVYEITLSKNDVYTLTSVENVSNIVESVDIDDIHGFVPKYKKNQSAIWQGAKHIISERHPDGTYVLKNGEEVMEYDLSDWIPILKNGSIVRVLPNKVVYKVVGHSGGNYSLQSIFDESTLSCRTDEATEHEQPEFAEGEYAQLANEEYPRKVKKFLRRKWAYVLEGLSTEFKESDLNEPSFEPAYEQGDKVLYEGKVYEIKKVIIERGEYELKGLNVCVHEDYLQPAEED